MAGTAIAPYVITGSFTLGTAVVTGGVAWLIARGSRKSSEAQALKTHELSLQAEAAAHERRLEAAAEADRRSVEAENVRWQRDRAEQACADFLAAVEMTRQTALDRASDKASQDELIEAVRSVSAARGRLLVTGSVELNTAAEKYVAALIALAAGMPNAEDADKAERKAGKALHNQVRMEFQLPDLFR